MSDLLTNMLSRLTGAYNKSPDSNTGNLFSIFAEGLFDIEGALNVIDLWRDVDQAKGTTLDRMGRNFGVPRGSAPDPFYRLMIKTKITAMLSGGDIDTIITATSVLFGVLPEQVETVERFPAKMRVILDIEDVNPEYMLYAAGSAQLIMRLIAAGVGKEVLFRYRMQAPGVLRVGATSYWDVHLTITPMEG